ncbi:MAG: integrase family protein [Halothiobacillaceae bacterium]
MYAYVTKAGTISWRYDFSHDGKAGTVTLGQYPVMSLADARKAHEAARESLAKGLKPGAQNATESAKKTRFSDYAKQLLERQELAPATHAKKLMRALWPRRKKKISLYSARHQFAADAKSADLMPEMIAALMGYAVTETHQTHYGKRRFGHGRVMKASLSFQLRNQSLFCLLA